MKKKGDGEGMVMGKRERKRGVNEERRVKNREKENGVRSLEGGKNGGQA